MEEVTPGQRFDVLLTAPEQPATQHRAPRANALQRNGSGRKSKPEAPSNPLPLGSLPAEEPIDLI